MSLRSLLISFVVFICLTSVAHGQHQDARGKQGLFSELKKSAVPLDDGTPDSICQRLRDFAIAFNQNQMYAVAYDTETHFIERCANSKESWREFGYMQASVQYLSSDLNRFFAFRDFLKSVLWLNTTDPMYYCHAVEAIMFTYQWNGPTRGTDQNAALAIIKYLMESNKCPMDSAYLHDTYAYTRHDQWQTYRDTVKLGGPPLDTTLPSLEELGLEVLRGPQNAVHASPNFVGDLSSLTASANPFVAKTTLTLLLNHTAYIQFAVYDALGRWVDGWDNGHVRPAGTYEIPVDLSHSSEGTYYARISTSNGEVQTLKLVKLR